MSMFRDACMSKQFVHKILVIGCSMTHEIPEQLKQSQLGPIQIFQTFHPRFYPTHSREQVAPY